MPNSEHPSWCVCEACKRLPIGRVRPSTPPEPGAVQQVIEVLSRAAQTTDEGLSYDLIMRAIDRLAALSSSVPSGECDECQRKDATIAGLIDRLAQDANGRFGGEAAEAVSTPQGGIYGPETASSITAGSSEPADRSQSTVASGGSPDLREWVKEFAETLRSEAEGHASSAASEARLSPREMFGGRNKQAEINEMVQRALDYSKRRIADAMDAALSSSVSQKGE